MTESLPWLLFDAHRVRKRGAATVLERQARRFADMVAFARANSPYYRELYQGLPERIEDPTQLPVTSKKRLMSRFDDWAVDRDVTLERARTFIDNPDLIGERFLGKYTVVTTSGTTGTPGIFILDDRTMAVVNAVAFRMLSSWLTAADVFKLLVGGGRMSMVMATGGHFASTTAAARLRKGSQRRTKRIQVLSVHMPMQELVAQLNRFRPVVVAPYASLAALLADEQEAGRLHINPVLMALSAEGLPGSEYERIAKTFGAKVGNSYAASECPFLSYSCEQGWLHVNADWVLLEPVDADHRPTPPGEQSHTVLISNLANRVQPILRYDLGDSVLQRADACPCGNPLPAFRVQGRAADVLTFSTEGGERVAIPPLAFGLLGDRPGIELFQIVQGSSTSLRVRLRTAAGADPEAVWQTVQADIKRLLAERKLGHVAVARAEEPPEQSPGGKYRAIIPLR
jgi:phenylacetate-CoA ligase